MNCCLAPFIFARFILFLSCIKTGLNTDGVRTTAHLLPSVSDVGVPQAVRKLQVGFHPTGEPPPGADRWWRGCTLWGAPRITPAAPPCPLAPCCCAGTETNALHHTLTHTHTLIDRNVNFRPPSSLQLHHPLLLL